jgi:hypothetical protein
MCFVYCPSSWACDYYFNPLAAYGQGYYYLPTGYSQESIPYFASHPPVYYSYLVPRAYGDSPFSYPPGTMDSMTNSPPAQPQIIKNWYIDNDTSPIEQQTQARKPLRIINPYVEQNAEQADNAYVSKGVKWGIAKTPKPLVVYPTSNAVKKRIFSIN